MSDRLIIIDGYNLIHRTPQLKPGVDGRTLRDSRDKLINLLSWMMGANNAAFIVVFDGAEERGRESRSGRVEIRWSRPPETADDVIRRLVEEKVDRSDQVVVVTADLEVARHARAMGADISLSDLFLAGALGGGAQAEGEKPTTLTKKEIEEWAALFRSRPQAPPDPDDDE